MPFPQLPQDRNRTQKAAWHLPRQGNAADFPALASRAAERREGREAQALRPQPMPRPPQGRRRIPSHAHSPKPLPGRDTRPG